MDGASNENEDAVLNSYRPIWPTSFNKCYLSKIYHWNYQTTIFYYVVEGTGASKKSAPSCLVLQDYIWYDTIIPLWQFTIGDVKAIMGYSST